MSAGGKLQFFIGMISILHPLLIFSVCFSLRQAASPSDGKDGH